MPDMPVTKEIINPAKGLSPTDVAILAVLNSPDLKARRAARKVAAAQVFAAGLLPDPQVVVSMDIPAPSQMASTAYGIAPSLDLTSLVTHAAALKAARASKRQTDLDVLWAEWSVAQQARVLAETILAEEAKLTALTGFSTIAARHARHSDQALRRGDLAAQVADADLAVEIDADSQAALARAAAKRARLDLNALIGLQPDVELTLRPEAPMAAWPKLEIEQMAGTVSRRRPDLLALQSGYMAQEASLRRSLLAQFPILNLGLNHAQDNTGILSNGPSATLTLPLFRTSRGPVAIEAATRDQLRAEYQARLDLTQAETAANVAARDIDEAEARRLTEELPKLKALNLSAQAAWSRGDIDGATYVVQAQTYLLKLSDLQDRRLAARLAEIALEAALFVPPASAVAETRP
jgi:outer membrane protein TolC